MVGIEVVEVEAMTAKGGGSALLLALFAGVIEDETPETEALADSLDCLNPTLICASLST